MMKPITSILVCVAGLAATLGSACATPCQDGGGTGGWVYNGLIVPGFSDGLVLRCQSQSAAGNIAVTAQYAGGPALATLGLSASAFGEPGSVHASARSQLLSGGRPQDLTNPYPAAAVAHAASSLVFTLNAPVGTPAHVLAPVEFEIRGGGQMGGEHSFGSFAGYGRYGLLFPSNGIRWSETGHYQDSNGVVRDSGYAGSLWDGPPLDIEFDIDRLGMFEAGQNYFQVVLDVIGYGNGFADFSHTASVTGLRVPAGYSLTLPDGLFTVDPTDARHYILAAIDPPATVPEPSTAAMAALGGLLACAATRRRRWGHAGLSGTGGRARCRRECSTVRA